MTATADSDTSPTHHQPIPAGEKPATSAGNATSEEPDSAAAQLRALRAALDDTTRQRDQLASSLTLAHTVIERMADAAFWAQTDGRLIYVNEAACRELGYSHEELMALSVVDLVPNYTEAEWAAHLTALREAGTLCFVGWNQRKDGSIFPVEVSTNLIQSGSTVYACSIVRNISARVEAQRALADSEAKFAAAFDLSPNAMSLTELSTGEFIDVNDAFLATTGYSRSEAIGRSSLELNLYADPNDRAALLADIARLGHVANRPMQVRTKHGELRDCLIAGRTLTVGERSLLLASIMDVTEQSQVHKSLLESEERFRLAFENANDGVCLVGLDGALLRVNARMAAMFGYSSGEMERMSVQDITHPDSLEASPTFIRHAVAGDSEHGVFIKRYIHCNGHDVWGRVSSSLVRDAAGEPLYFISHVQDITEWRRAQAELADREARLHAIYNYAGVAIALTDIDGRVLDCNPYWQKLLGYTGSDWRGLNVHEITHPDDVAEAQRSMQALVAGHIDSYRFEMRYVRPAGQIIWGDLSVSPLRDEQGMLTALIGVWTDITWRKAAEVALRESEERYRLVMQGSGAGIWDWDIVNHRVFYSLQWKRMRGYTDDEISDSDREWSERIHPDDRALVQDALAVIFTAAARTTDDPPRFALAYRTRHKDGSWLWIHDEGIVQLGADGSPVRMIGTEVDITQRRRAEEALRRSEGRLRAIFEASQSAIILSSLSGTIEFANHAAADLFGRPMDQLIGSAYLSYVHPDEAGVAGQLMRRLAGNDLGSLLTERHYRRLDGSEFWGLLSTRPLHDEQGTPVALLGIITDVTEYRHLVNSLRASADALRRAQAVARLGNWVWHIPEDRLEWSDEMYTIFGIKETEFTGNLSDVLAAAIHPDDRAAVEASNRAVIEAATAQPLEYRVIRPDGSVRTVWAEAGELIRDREGQPLRLTGIVQDITERKEAEAERERLLLQLQQAHKMETIGRLAGGIAHDFNNLLAVILMRLEMAIALAEPEAPIRRHLNESLRAAERSAELTRQLLGFARLQPVAPKVLDLNLTVADMLAVVKQLIGEEINLEWQPAPELWPVKLDPAQLSQILTNLCVNARDAIDGTGTILIATQNVLFDLPTEEAGATVMTTPHVLLTVSDDGSGMDRAVLERIFEPFVTTKGVGRGTGLGLATVYGIVQQNGGEIRVYSEPGIGTTFRIYLPRHAGAYEHTADETPNEAPRGTGETILLVEDERAVMEMAHELLDQLGYAVLAAATPGEALKVASNFSGEIDLMVTDVIMPEMNGRELAEQVRARRPAIKVLYISGYPADLIAHRGVLGGDANLLAKPFARHILARRVRETLEQVPGDAATRPD